MHDTANLMGDTGVEAVLRMATTTPALKTLNLTSVCLQGRFVRDCGGFGDVVCAYTCLCVCVMCLFPFCHSVILSFCLSDPAVFCIPSFCMCDASVRHDCGGRNACGVVAGREPASAGASFWLYVVCAGVVDGGCG